MSIFNRYQRSKKEISVLDKKSTCLGLKSENFKLILFLGLLISSLSLSQAWAGPLNSRSERRGLPSAPSNTDSTEKQLPAEEDSEYQQPQQSVPQQLVMDKNIDLLKEKLNQKVSTAASQPASIGGCQPHFGSSMLKAAFSLVLVLALIWVMGYLLKKYYLKGNLLGEKLIRTLDTCSLGSRGSLALVRVENQTMLLGITSQEITLLARVDLPDKTNPETPKAQTPENRPSARPYPAARPGRRSMQAQPGMQTRHSGPVQSSSRAEGYNLPPEDWTGLDGEENNGIGDFAEQLSLQSLRFQQSPRFQSPAQPDVQESPSCAPSPLSSSHKGIGQNEEPSSNNIAAILESRFKGLKRI